MACLILEPEIIFPSKDLSHVIHHFEFIQFKEHSSYASNLFPSLETGLLFNFNQNFLNSSKDAIHREFILYPCSFVPPQTLPYWLYLQNYFVGLKVVFQPGMFSNFFDTHLQAFQNQFIDASLHFDPRLRSLHKELSNLGDNEKKVHTFEAYLRHSLKNQSSLNKCSFFPLFRQITDKFYPKETTSDLALRLKISRRHLNRILNQQLGFSTKKFLKILRFTRLLYFIHRNMQIDFCQIALEFDFCDQAHFSHEFKQMSGFSPRNYLKWMKQTKILTPPEYSQNGILIFPNRILFENNQSSLVKKNLIQEFQNGISSQVVTLAK